MTASKIKSKLSKRFSKYWESEGKKILLRNAKENGYYGDIKKLLTHRKNDFNLILDKMLWSFAEKDNIMVELYVHSYNFFYDRRLPTYICRSSIRHFYMFWFVYFLGFVLGKPYENVNKYTREIEENVFKDHMVKKAIVEFVHVRIIFPLTCVKRMLRGLFKL